MKKNPVKLLFTLLMLAAFSCISCNNILQNTPTERATITINLSNNARNILPDVKASDLTNFQLQGTHEGKEKNLGTWTTYEELSSAAIDVEPGKWELSLYAKKGGAYFSGTTTITAERSKTVSASFNLTIVTNSSTEKGTANLTFTYPKTFGIKAADVMIGTEYLTDDEITISETSLSFEKELDAGNYFLQITFYQDSKKERKIGFYYDNVVIEAGLSSNATIPVNYLAYGKPTIGEPKNNDNGIQFDITVPANTKSLVIKRKEVDPDDILKYESNINWMWDEPDLCSTSNSTDKDITVTIKDRYEIEKGKTYIYGMYVNYKYLLPLFAITAENDGWKLPTFTQEPVIKFNPEDMTIVFEKVPVIKFNNGEDPDWQFRCQYPKYDETKNPPYDYTYGWYPVYDPDWNNDIMDFSNTGVPAGTILKLQYSQLVIKEDGVDYLHIYYDDFDIQETIKVPYQIKETEDGISIKVPVFNGTQEVDILRSEDGENFTKIGDRYYGSENAPKENTSITFVDAYGYTAGTKYTYRVMYDWWKILDEEGITFTPSKNGKPVPQVFSMPEYTFSKDTITFTKKAHIYFDGNTPDSETRICLGLHYITGNEEFYSDDDNIWYDWNYDGEETQVNLYNTIRDGKTFRLKEVSLLYKYKNGTESYWIVPKKVWENCPDLTFEKRLKDPIIQTQPAATLNDTTLTFTSKGSVNLENTAYEDYKGNVYFVYTYKDEADNAYNIIADLTNDELYVAKDNKLIKQTDSYSSIDLHCPPLDGVTLNFDSAKAVLGQAYNQPQFSLDFEPGNNMPSKIEFPQYYPKLTAKATDDGIELTVSDLKLLQDFNDSRLKIMEVVENKNGDRKYNYVFDIFAKKSWESFTEDSITLTDKFVTKDKTYTYCIDVNNEKVSECSVKATGGVGEIAAPKPTKAGIELTVPEDEEIKISKFYDFYYNYPSSTAKIYTSSSTTDYFTSAGSSYYYEYTIDLSNEDISCAYFPHFDSSSTVTATGGLGELKITNEPVAAYDSAKNQLEFSTVPDIGIQSLPEGYKAVITFEYRGYQYWGEAFEYTVGSTTCDLSEWKPDSYYPDTYYSISIINANDETIYKVALNKNFSNLPKFTIEDPTAPVLTAIATEEGIELTVSNLQENVSCVGIISAIQETDGQGMYENQKEIASFKSLTNNNDITFTDKYVDPNKSYTYYVDVSYSENSYVSHLSQRIAVKATNGLGELKLGIEPVDDGIKISLPETPENYELHNRGLSSLTKTSDEYTASYDLNDEAENGFTDIFTSKGTVYTYVYDATYYRNNETIYYRPHTKAVTVTATGGIGDLRITNEPAAEFDESESKLKFTTAPIINPEILPENYSINLQFMYLGEESGPMFLEYDSDGEFCWGTDNYPFMSFNNIYRVNAAFPEGSCSVDWKCSFGGMPDIVNTSIPPEDPDEPDPTTDPDPDLGEGND